MTETYPTPEFGGPEAVFSGCFIIVIVLIALALNIAYIVAFCKICSKAGYSWALGLLMLVPIANIILPLYLGFAEWPIERQFRGVRDVPPPPQNFRGM